MEEDPDNGKESSHSAHADGMNECDIIRGYLMLRKVIYAFAGNVPFW